MLSTKKRIAFVVYHGIGHFNACFNLARKFKQEHEVLFVGVEYFKNYVEGQGFQYYTLKSLPFGLNFENWINKISKKKFVWWKTLKDRWQDRLYFHRQSEFKKLILDFNPDYILIDSLQSTDFIVLHPLVKGLGTHLGFISTTLPVQLNRDEPPINSLSVPGDYKGIAKAQLLVQLNQRLKRVIQKIKYLGMDDLHIIKRRIKRNTIPVHYLSAVNGLFTPAFKSIPEFIFAPQEFNFPKNKVLPFQYYLGLQIDHLRTEPADPEFIRKKESIYRQVSEKKSKLIYCSFGTTPLIERNSVIRILNNVIHATRDQNYILLISFQSIAGELETLISDFPHVFIFKTLPQLEILSNTDIFITHGGLNSIKESINAGVPMLVYLTETRRDQKGNAARVAFHNIGIIGDLHYDSPLAVQAHINSLLSNAPAFKQRILNLKTQNSSIDILQILDSGELFKQP